MNQFKNHKRTDMVVGPWGNWRALFNVFALLVAIIYTAVQIQSPTFLEWLVLPGMMLVGNAAIWLIHKYPLHRYWKWYTFPYYEHTVKHHNFFQYHDLEIRSWKEIGNIVFPPQVVLAFVVGYVPAVYFLSQLVFTQNTAWFIVLGSSIYFLMYEVMHTISHLPEQHVILRKFPFLKFMWNHHRIHHHLRLMSKWNFNIVYPLFDWLMGTMITELPPEVAKLELNCPP